MNRNRLNKLKESMQKNGLNQLIISDEWSIYYLTDTKFSTGHRFIGLLVSLDKNEQLYLHEMFPTNGLEKEIDIVKWKDTDDYLKMLATQLDSTKSIGVDKYLEARYLLPLQALTNSSNFVLGSYVIDHLRGIKDSEEIKLMENASRINDQAMMQLQAYIHNTQGSITEEMVRAQLEKIYAQYTDEGYSFAPIVGFGKNAANPHHKVDDTVLEKGNCIVLDIGCYKDKYASDMTRTIFYQEVSDFKRKIYEIVKQAHILAAAAIKPGVKASDIDKVARDYISNQGYGEYFTHRLGHFIGMEVHEAGDISASNDQVLEVGNIFSIEPGIYLADEEVGVRIENLYVVEADGARSLNQVSLDLVVV